MVKRSQGTCQLSSQCIDIIAALGPDSRYNSIGIQGLDNVTSDRLLLIVQECVSLCLRFSRPGGSRVAQSPKIRDDIVFLRSGDCLQDSLWSLSRFRNQEVYAVVVATFPGEFYPGGVTDVIAVEEVADVLKEKTRNPMLRHHKHIIDGQHRLNKGV